MRISSLSLAPIRSEDQPRPRPPNHLLPQARKVPTQSRSHPLCASDPPSSSTWSLIKSSRQRITASVSTTQNGASHFPTTCRYPRPICPSNCSSKSIMISKITKLRLRSMKSIAATKSCNCTSLRPSIGKSAKVSTLTRGCWPRIHSTTMPKQGPSRSSNLETPCPCVWRQQPNKNTWHFSRVKDRACIRGTSTVSTILWWLNHGHLLIMIRPLLIIGICCRCKSAPICENYRKMFKLR